MPGGHLSVDPGIPYMGSLCELFHENFRSVLALNTDVETVFGVGNADTLEVVVFNRSVGVSGDYVIDA